MKLENPEQLWWGLLAIPIVVAYFVTFVRRQRQLATISLWQEALARRTPWLRWRRSVSLAVQLVVLALLVAALAQPEWTTGDDAKSIVIVIDTSASMRATDVAPSRIAQAVDRARQIVESLGRHDRAAIVSAGNTPRVHCQLTADELRLRLALNSVAAGDGPTRIESGLQLARRMLEGIDNTQIFVATDGCFPSAAQLAKAKDVQWLTVGDSADNVAITRFEARPSWSSPSDYQVFVEVENFRSHEITGMLEVGLAGKAATQRSLKIAAGGRLQQKFSVAAPAGGLIEARLDVEDDLTTDNRAQSIVPPRRIVRVALKGTQLENLQRALATIPTIELTDDESTAAGAKADVTILNRPQSASLPAGPLLAIAPTGDAEGLWTLSGDGGRQVMVQRQAASPLLAGIDLRGVVIERPAKLNFAAANNKALVAAADGAALYTAIERAAGDVLVWHAPLEAGDLAMHSQFPLLLAAAVSWLAENDERYEPSFDTKSAVALDRSNEARVATSPRGHRRSLVADVPSFLPLETAGLWTVEGAAPAAGETSKSKPKPQLAFAASLIDRGESDLEPKIQLPAATWASSNRGLAAPWLYLVMATLLVVAVDWTLYRRRDLE